MKLLLENWKKYLKENKETDSQFLKRLLAGDQELRNLFSKDIKDSGGWSQDLVNKFVEKHKTSTDDVFNDKKRMKEFVEQESKLNYSGFSDEDWNNYFIIVMHADPYPQIQEKALKLFKDKFGESDNKYKNLLFRIARRNGIIKIPTDYTLNLEKIDDEAKKFNVHWKQLSSKI